VVNDEDEDATTYQVVVNDEEQYSIWPADREVPGGWRSVGPKGKKAECLAYVESVWTDMRPLSLRRRAERAAAKDE
jgi:MbtH protein